MKNIEKTNHYGLTQYFTILTSKADLRTWLKDFWRDAIWCNAYNENIQEDEAIPEVPEDWSIAYFLDNIEQAYGEGDLLPRRPNANRIDRLIFNDGYQTVIYGNIEIIYDNEAKCWREDWQ